MPRSARTNYTITESIEYNRRGWNESLVFARYRITIVETYTEDYGYRGQDVTERYALTQKRATAKAAKLVARLKSDNEKRVVTKTHQVSA